jgi:hypothetical protein
MSDLGVYRLTFGRADGPPSVLSQFTIPVGNGLLWEAPPWEVMELQPAITLEYFPPAVDPQAEVERLRGLLAALEWAGIWPGSGAKDINVPGFSYCPVCKGSPEDPDAPGHAADCWLAAELGR